MDDGDRHGGVYATRAYMDKGRLAWPPARRLKKHRGRALIRPYNGDVVMPQTHPNLPPVHLATSPWLQRTLRYVTSPVCPSPWRCIDVWTRLFAWRPARRGDAPPTTSISPFVASLSPLPFEPMLPFSPYVPSMCTWMCMYTPVFPHPGQRGAGTRRPPPRAAHPSLSQPSSP